MNAAVSRVQHEPSGADGPAFAGVDETYVEEIGICRRRFGEPHAPAIVGREDLARCAHGPTVVANKTRGSKSRARAIAHNAGLPGHAAVARVNDGAARAD